MEDTEKREDKDHLVLNVTVNGGNVQVLPTATKAVQNIYNGAVGSASVPSTAEHTWTPDDVSRLAIYVKDDDARESLIASLAACRSAREVGRVVVRLCADDPAVTSELIVKETFIEVIVPFLTGFDSGKGIDNLRVYINEALMEDKHSRRGNR